MPGICPHCHIGSPKKQKGIWAQIINSHLIQIPEIAIEVCDACGWVEYDQAALAQLSALFTSSSLQDRERSAQPHPQQRTWFG